MGKSISDQKEQLNFLHSKMELLMTMLDSIEPEAAGVEDIDRIIEMLDDIENKCKKFRNDLKED
ncbi:MAG: SE1561 family protein [Anaerobacillus sp.]|uniref:SE1561 family protein n=1 Tax=Anaerobacillus sp. TaxID=1872506 RepID=UPI00391C09CE